MSEVANDHLSGEAKYAPLNDPRCWNETRKAPLFNVKKVQKRIDEIVGTTITNEPIIRLVWAWDSWEMIYGRKWQRHSFFSLKHGDVDEDISVPRFVIEQRFEPDLFVSAWEATRYQHGPDGGVIDCGPAPKVWWDSLWVIADHDGHPVETPKAWCCKRAKKMDRPCWGLYRHPDGWDIEEIRRINALKQRAEQRGRSPFKPLSNEELTRIRQASFNRLQENKVKAQAELKQRLVDHFNVHGHRLSGDPGVVKHGQYHFTKSESGLLTPAN